MPGNRGLLSFLLAAGVFSFGIVQGLRMAVVKSLWGDEVFSMEHTIRSMTYGQIWAGQAQEGNNSPLFYTVEKAVLSSVGLDAGISRRWQALIVDNDLIIPRTPAQQFMSRVLQSLAGRKQWAQEQLGLMDRWQARTAFTIRVTLRLVPVFFTALGMALLVGYMTRWYSVGSALVALMVLLGSGPFWSSWADARPYAMVVCFTICQGLLLLHMTRRGIYPWGLGLLVLVHAFLVLTYVPSALPVVAAGGVLAWRGCRNGWFWGAGIVFPVAVAAGYWLLRVADTSGYFLSLGHMAGVIRSGFPWPAVLIPLAATAGMFFWRGSRQRFDWLAWWWGVVVLHLLMAAWFWFRGEPGHGFPVVGRYFLVIIPVTAVVSGAVLGELFRVADNPRARLFIWGLSLLVVAPGVIQVVRWLLSGNLPQYQLI